MAPPPSPGWGGTYASAKGESVTILPLATLFIAQPPEMQTFALPVLRCTAASITPKTSS